MHRYDVNCKYFPCCLNLLIPIILLLYTFLFGFKIADFLHLVLTLGLAWTSNGDLEKLIEMNQFGFCA